MPVTYKLNQNGLAYLHESARICEIPDSDLNYMLALAERAANDAFHAAPRVKEVKIASTRNTQNPNWGPRTLTIKPSWFDRVEGEGA